MELSLKKHSHFSRFFFFIIIALLSTLSSDAVAYKRQKNCLESPLGREIRWYWSPGEFVNAYYLLNKLPIPVVSQVEENHDYPEYILIRTLNNEIKYYDFVKMDSKIFSSIREAEKSGYHDQLSALLKILIRNYIPHELLPYSKNILRTSYYFNKTLGIYTNYLLHKIFVSSSAPVSNEARAEALRGLRTLLTSSAIKERASKDFPAISEIPELREYVSHDAVDENETSSQLCYGSLVYNERVDPNSTMPFPHNKSFSYRISGARIKYEIGEDGKVKIDKEDLATNRLVEAIVNFTPDGPGKCPYDFLRAVIQNARFARRMEMSREDLIAWNLERFYCGSSKYISGITKDGEQKESFGNFDLSPGSTSIPDWLCDTWSHELPRIDDFWRPKLDDLRSSQRSF